MISIILPTYNNAKALRDYSLPSLLKQTVSDWEVIVINDGSNDNSLEIINKFATNDKRIKLVSCDKNKGLAASLNLGVKLSQGEIITILEHDDIWLPRKLELQIESMLMTRAKVSTCQAIIYNTKDKVFTRINNGNLSCLAFRREFLNHIFPLPEENKKYLGIEDGVISAQLAIAKFEGKLKENEEIHIEKILTIMNSGIDTLSGMRNSLVMKNRYKNAFNLYKNMAGKYQEINNLLSFWKKHYLYNSIISIFPNFIKKIIYSLVEKLKKIKDKKAINAFYKTKEYKIIKEYRNYFN